MLQFIRDRAQSWIAFLIIGMLIIALSAVAWDAFFRPDPVVAAATVNGEKITAQQFQRQYQGERARLQKMLGGQDISKLIPDEAKYKLSILRRAINEELLWQAAHASGYRIDNAILAGQIRSFDFFQTDGKFDPELYKRVLGQNFMSSSAYEDVVRRGITIQQVETGITGTEWVTPEETSAIYDLQKQTRDIGYLTIPVSKFVDGIKLDEGEAKAYYQDHSSEFTAPEQVSLEYIELAVPDLMPLVDVDDAALREEYERRKNEFQVPEERRVSQILIEVAADASEKDVDAARAKVEDLRKRVAKGEAFETLAKDNSDDVGSAANGGDLGFMSRDAMGEMDQAFADAAFGLKVGEVSEPVRTSFGFQLIKLAEVKQQEAKSFEDVRADLEKSYRRQKAEEMFYERGETLANLTFENPDSLLPASEALGLTVKTTPMFSREHGVGIATNPKVLSLAFSDDVLGGGNNSEPVELATDRVAVFRVKEHQEERVRAFEEVAQVVEGKLRSEKAKAKAESVGAEILDAAKVAGSDIEAIAKQYDVEWKRPDPVERNSTAISRAIVEKAFRMPHPAENAPEWEGLALNNGDYGVFALYGVKTPVEEQTDDAQKQSIAQRREKVLGGAELAGMVEHLKLQAVIKEYPENL